jgi:hypothetical protein
VYRLCLPVAILTAAAIAGTAPTIAPATDVLAATSSRD